MMCEHCENRVKKSLEALDGVEEAVVSSDEGTAVVSFSAPVAEDALKAAVADAGYTFESME